MEELPTRPRRSPRALDSAPLEGCQLSCTPMGTAACVFNDKGMRSYKKGLRVWHLGLIWDRDRGSNVQYRLHDTLLVFHASVQKYIKTIRRRSVLKISAVLFCRALPTVADVWEFPVDATRQTFCQTGVV